MWTPKFAFGVCQGIHSPLAIYPQIPKYWTIPYTLCNTDVKAGSLRQWILSIMKAYGRGLWLKDLNGGPGWKQCWQSFHIRATSQLSQLGQATGRVLHRTLVTTSQRNKHTTLIGRIFIVLWITFIFVEIDSSSIVNEFHHSAFPFNFEHWLAEIFILLFTRSPQIYGGVLLCSLYPPPLSYYLSLVPPSLLPAVYK